MADYTAWTIVQLETEFIRLGHLLAGLQDARHALYRLIMTRKAEASAVQRVALLSHIEKDALREVLK